MSLLDYKVRFMSEAAVADAAAACREIGTARGSDLVNLKTILDELEAHGVESIYKLPWSRPKGCLKIQIVEDSTREFPAWVEFSPALTLSVQKTVWRKFIEGYSKECEIIAHEIGHIVLHDSTALPFVGDKELYLKFTGSQEDFAEWQANTFAEHLLIPDSTIQKYMNTEKIAYYCNTENAYAKERLARYIKSLKPITTVFDDNPCPRCGDFTFSTLKNPPKCSSCGFIVAPQASLGKGNADHSVQS
jgi:hypothetical protein